MARPVPLDLAGAFSRFRGADPERLHFAAHSHHFWPDVTEAAQQLAWADAARLADDKWDHVLGEVWPAVRVMLARHLNLPDPATLVPAPNTFEFVNRLLSCGPLDRPMRVVTSDGEFHSFRRQTERLKEDGIIALTQVPAEPFATFATRLAAAVKEEAPDLVFVSQVFFNSGFALTDLEALVDQVAAPERLVVIDGYHGFMARPTDLSRIATRAFYIAGGYKYAMAGEGACFMHCPPGFAPRPRNTGWYASFGNLAGVQTGVPYAEDGWRFMGATFDPSGLYRLRAVLEWLASEEIDAALIHAHVEVLQQQFMAAMAEKSWGLFTADNLVVPLDNPARGNFLTFQSADAGAWYDRLHAAGIVTDVRGDRLRLGFGLYHTAADVERLLTRLRSL
ncbi:aminotransferase class V-fold PLP-dependent enzyme [Pseudolabrys sp. FHR47]|uniref:aminotransferase class V-fold PLP-dependent enzyme n=1 Tax=Pseudolabrys sp. FHR47 TaxID=2562284 RepID=UPI0010BE83EE|nr:aminotransferase class V-fold PLP-dependent enzyme [Pseudolabrys sp. FHR47]